MGLLTVGSSGVVAAFAGSAGSAVVSFTGALTASFGDSVATGFAAAGVLIGFSSFLSASGAASTLAGASRSTCPFILICGRKSSGTIVFTSSVARRSDF